MARSKSNRDIGLVVQWLTGCQTEKERDARRSLLLGADPAFRVLLAIIEQGREDLLACREADYNDSAWACKQAHRNGRLEELDRLSYLLRSITDHT